MRSTGVSVEHEYFAPRAGSYFIAVHVAEKEISPIESISDEAEATPRATLAAGVVN